MRTTQIVLAGIILFFSLPSFAADCAEQSQAGTRDCLEQNVKASAAALSAAEREALTALSKWDDDPKYKAIAKRKLLAASKAFATYRQTNCAWRESRIGGGAGNAHEIARLSCVSEMNTARLAEFTKDSAASP